MEYYPLKITKKIKESEGCFSFYFEPVNSDHASVFEYRTAQFLTFKFEIDSKTFVRSYSLSCSPILQEPLQTTVKKVPDGKVSQYMVDTLNEGDVVLSQAPLGQFYKLPKSLSRQEYVLFAAGIGVTPLFSILKTALALSSEDQVTLVFSSPKEEDIIYKQELAELQKKYPKQLKVHNILSRVEGRLDDLKIFQILKNIKLKQAVFYLCGPKEYMTFIKKNLEDHQVDPNKIHIEDFKVVPITYPLPDEQSVIYEVGSYEEGEPEEIRAIVEGQDIHLKAQPGKSILDQLLDKGYNVPFSCASGNCMTCMAKLKQGKVFQLEEGILDEENKVAQELLTCQSYPLSKKIFIDYDDL